MVSNDDEYDSISAASDMWHDMKDAWNRSETKIIRGRLVHFAEETIVSPAMPWFWQGPGWTTNGGVEITREEFDAAPEASEVVRKELG